MQPNSVNELYASKTDEELLLLAAEKDSLVESAQLALEDEIHRRNLDSSHRSGLTTEVSAVAESTSEHHEPLEIRSGIQWMGFFLLNTLLVYMCVYVSRLLVGRYFLVVAAALDVPQRGSPWDWYLRHLEWLTIIPALVAGYIDVARFLPATVGKRIGEWRSGSTSTCVWVLPTVLLLYKMLRVAFSSALSGTSMSAFRYLFDIQKVMPTFANPLASDPVRVLAQMYVTAPFYAGVAFSVGALLWKHRLLPRLFRSLS